MSRLDIDFNEARKNVGLPPADKHDPLCCLGGYEVPEKGCAECFLLARAEQRGYNQMAAAIQRVRDLHKPQLYHSPGCSDGCCGDGEEFDICRHCVTQYPCETIEALDGEQE